MGAGASTDGNNLSVAAQSPDQRAQNVRQQQQALQSPKKQTNETAGNISGAIADQVKNIARLAVPQPQASPVKIEGEFDVFFFVCSTKFTGGLT